MADYATIYYIFLYAIIFPKVQTDIHSDSVLKRFKRTPQSKIWILRKSGFESGEITSSVKCLPLIHFEKQMTYFTVNINQKT